MAGVSTQFVTFSLDREVFAAPVAQVREILDYRPASRIPHGPDYLLGLIDVRGQGAPVLDLRRRLGLAQAEPTPQTRILVMDVMLDDRVVTLGMVADRVFEVVAFTADEIEPAPDIGVRWRSEYIAGVVRRPDGFVVIMHLARLVGDEEGAFMRAAGDAAA